MTARYTRTVSREPWSALCRNERTQRMIKRTPEMDARDKEIRDMAAASVPVVDICTAYSLSESQVRRIINLNKPRPERKPSGATVINNSVAHHEFPTVAADGSMEVPEGWSVARIAPDVQVIESDGNVTIIPQHKHPNPFAHTWVIEFIGHVEVEAESIDQALAEVRRRGMVRIITSATRKG